MKILIVGGVAGGASAAARARRLSEEAEIILFERGPDISFANCGLPYHIGETIVERSRLLVASPELLRDRLRIDVRVRSEVERIDRGRKCLRVRDLAANQEYEESYDRLILAPGARPIRPPLSGIDHPAVHTLRDLGDMDRIKQSVDRGARRAVVVGGGFIGIEVVENLVGRGVQTSLVQLDDQLLSPFDPEMTQPMATAVREAGVDLRLGDSAEAFEPAGDGVRVRLRSGGVLDADLVLLGIGVQPESGLAANAGLEVGKRGGIRVDRHLGTSDPDIFAVGDAIEVTDYVLGVPEQVPLAGPANRQGRIAADNALGRSSEYRGTQGTAIVGAFGVTAAMTGASEKRLVEAGEPFERVYVHPTDHAGYYPGAARMTLKVLFSRKDGRLLGAQATGGAGVDKRIDVLAIAIQAGMTVFDLEEAELCYAPQYGSAKDPVNMAGFVAAGLLRGDHPQAGPADLRPESAGGPLLVDVRSESEFTDGSIEGAVNVPIDQLRSRLDEMPEDRAIVPFCRVGQRGYLATRILNQSGRQAKNLAGGVLAYRLASRASTSTEP